MPAEGEKFGTQALDGEKDQDFLQLLEQKVEGTLNQELDRPALRPPFAPRAALTRSVCPSLRQVLLRPLEPQCLLPAASVRTAAT